MDEFLWGPFGKTIVNNNNQFKSINNYGNPGIISNIIEIEIDIVYEIKIICKMSSKDKSYLKLFIADPETTKPYIIIDKPTINKSNRIISHTFVNKYNKKIVFGLLIYKPRKNITFTIDLCKIFNHSDKINNKKNIKKNIKEDKRENKKEDKKEDKKENKKEDKKQGIVKSKFYLELNDKNKKVKKKLFKTKHEKPIKPSLIAHPKKELSPPFLLQEINKNHIFNIDNIIISINQNIYLQKRSFLPYRILMDKIDKIIIYNGITKENIQKNIVINYNKNRNDKPLFKIKTNNKTNKKELSLIKLNNDILEIKNNPKKIRKNTIRYNKQYNYSIHYLFSKLFEL